MPPGESHVSRISKEYYVNYFNSSHRELGPPVVNVAQFILCLAEIVIALCIKMQVPLVNQQI